VRILTFSDLHGNGFCEASCLIDVSRPNWVVLCGDMLPDFKQRAEGSRLNAQEAFCPFGSCDKTLRGDHIGHRPLFRHLQDRNWPQGPVLCGHIHQSFGLEETGGTTILNVATGYALIEWSERFTHVMAMARLVKGENF